VHDWKELLEPVAARYRDSGLRKYLRENAAFARPEVYQYLEQEGFYYAIRLPANAVLQRGIDHLLTRASGAPSEAPRHLLPRLPLSGWELGAAPAGGGQGGVTPGGALAAGRLCGDQ